MGKIRTRLVGDVEVEKQQKEDQKKRSEEKKVAKKVHLPVMKGGMRTAEVTVDQTSLEKPLPSSNLSRTPNLPKTPKAKPRGKNYREAKKLVDKTKAYILKDAIELVKKMKTAKFDESIELHLDVDTTGLKGEVDLPHSTGKTVRVAIVNDKILEDIEKGKLDFDMLVTHPSYMPRLAKFAKVLGPKGLMPNPKAGTITPTPDEVVKKFSKGILRWKSEAKFPLVHQMIGKSSFETKDLEENAVKFIMAVGKPHVKKAYLKSTMSPSVRIDIERL